VCKWLYHILENIPLDICPGVVMTNCMVVLFLVFWGTTIVFSIIVSLIYIPTNSVEGIISLPHAHQHLFLCVFLLTAILTGVKWNLNDVFICISFMVKDVKHFFVYLLPFELFLLRSVCSVHLAIYSMGCWFCERLVFWALCIFWQLFPCQMYN
jgi:hypothetical protein